MFRYNNQVTECILECQFGNQIHAQLRDRLTAGIIMPNLNSELIQLPNCSFQDDRIERIKYEVVYKIRLHDTKNSTILLICANLACTQGYVGRCLLNDSPRSHENMYKTSLRIIKASCRVRHRFDK